MQNKRWNTFALATKHLLDTLLAVVVLIVLAPFLLIISAIIRADSTGPAIFTQTRIGLNGKPFNLYKFRTMILNAEYIGLGYNIERDDPRITKVGKFLRAWSLDELPQIFNILKGDMSFIGPRPTLKYQVDAYTPHQRKRLEMKPGITGWAQVNGRNTIPWETRIEYDVWYVENWSPWLDLKIFLKTFSVIFKRDAVYNEDGVSYDFHGSTDNQIEK